MRFSYDLDGVAYERPEVFSEIVQGLKSRGHEVGVLTGHRQSSKEKDYEKLKELGFPEPDFFVGRRPEEMHLNGSITKCQAIRDMEIVLHFDDFDYDHPDTIKLFGESLEGFKVARLKSVDDRFRGKQ